jgi:hypothetical protein
MFDVGAGMGKAGKVYLGVGYQYWHNKFGNMPGIGTQASLPQFQTEIHI